MFLSIVLAFGLSCPCAYAAEDNTGTPQGTYVNSKSDQSTIADSDMLAQLPDVKTAEGETGGAGNDDQNPPLPADPSTEPEPEPVPEPQGPLTFNFNLTKRPVINSVEQTSSGLMVTWSPIMEADGYIVLRRIRGAGDSINAKYMKGLSENSITLDAKLFKKANIQKTGWEKCKTVTSSYTISYVDTNASYEKIYEYSIIAYKANKATSNALIPFPYLLSYVRDRDISKPSLAMEGYRMKSPQFTSIKKKSKTMTVKWSRIAGAKGYTVQISKNSAFFGKKTKTVKGEASLSATFTSLSKSANYCVRVKAYGNPVYSTQYSMWAPSYFTSATKRASMSRLMYKYKVKKKEDKKADSNTKVKGASTVKAKKAKKKSKYIVKTKPFELRGRAKQAMGKYDTMQGGCSDGKYMYFVLLNKQNKRCKITKVKISTKKVVKVSKPLKLNHGNGLAYNPDTKRLIVAHADGNPKALTEINRSTLKKIKTHTVQAPSTLQGATVSQLKAYNGFSSIAYSPKKNVYVGLLYGSHNVALLDSNFKMIRYITLSKKKNQVYQCIEVAGDSILVGQSFESSSQPYNIIITYDWNGNYVTTTRLQKSFELENVFVAGAKVYAGFYRSYTKGKKFMRDNYVYRVNTF